MCVYGIGNQFHIPGTKKNILSKNKEQKKSRFLFRQILRAAEEDSISDTALWPIFILINIVTTLTGTHFYIRARSDGHVFFGKDPLSQKLWQIICVHSQQRQVLKNLDTESMLM